MDFIERWFGISPDGGDGSTELLILTALVIVIAAVLARRQLRRFLGR